MQVNKALAQQVKYMPPNRINISGGQATIKLTSGVQKALAQQPAACNSKLNTQG